MFNTAVKPKMNRSRFLIIIQSEKYWIHKGRQRNLPSPSFNTGLNLGSFILLFRLESIPKCFDFLRS